MAQVEDREFRSVTEQIDGNVYRRCRFIGCQLVYRGGPIPIFSGCTLEECRWTFDDAARRTIALLKGIHSGMGEGGKQLVEAMIQDIRTPFPKGQANPA